MAAPNHLCQKNYSMLHDMLDSTVWTTYFAVMIIVAQLPIIEVYYCYYIYSYKREIQYDSSNEENTYGLDKCTVK